jgi:hypothetical protein
VKSFHSIARIDHVKEDRARDIVGDVADDTELLAALGGDRTKIDGKNVLVQQREFLAVGELERGGHLVIQFDGRQMRKLLHELCRERAPARTDLEHVLCGLRIERADDLLDDILVVEKILS